MFAHDFFILESTRVDLNINERRSINEIMLFWINQLKKNRFSFWFLNIFIYCCYGLINVYINEYLSVQWLENLFSKVDRFISLEIITFSAPFWTIQSRITWKIVINLRFNVSRCGGHSIGARGSHLLFDQLQGKHDENPTHWLKMRFQLKIINVFDSRANEQRPQTDQDEKQLFH